MSSLSMTEGLIRHRMLTPDKFRFYLIIRRKQVNVPSTRKRVLSVYKSVCKFIEQMPLVNSHACRWSL